MAVRNPCLYTTKYNTIIHLTLNTTRLTPYAMTLSPGPHHLSLEPYTLNPEL